MPLPSAAPRFRRCPGLHPWNWQRDPIAINGEADRPANRLVSGFMVSPNLYIAGGEIEVNAARESIFRRRGRLETKHKPSIKDGVVAEDSG